MVHSRKYLITNEVLNAITHGIGFGLAVAGLVLLILNGVASGSVLAVVSMTIYGSMLTLLFLASTLYHSLIFTKAKKVFQVFDHSSIYLLIAGTYTPYCLLAVGGPLGWTLFGTIWALAIFGVVMKAIFLPKWDKVPKASTILYVIMGWLVMLAIVPLWRALEPGGFWLLVSGGVIYSLGAILYSFKFPFAHVIWHLFVLAAAILMWFSIYLYI
ncbi:MAG: hemolysin III family protein [Streptococcaceae bacterium]|nr:hemolysin III family protein [Streptococcaceae bacterium]